jgi:hypothetical protein
MQLRAVSVLDTVEDSNSTWSSTYCGLFAPYSDDYQLEGLQNNQWWSGISPSQEAIWAHNRQAGTRKIYCFQHDGGNVPYSLPINIWTIQCLLSESPSEQLPFSARVQRRGNRVTLDITNESNSPIQGGYVLFNNDQALTFGTIGGNATKQIKGPLQKKRLSRIHTFPHYSGVSPKVASDAYRAYVESQHERAFFAQGCLQRTQGIDAYLAHGAAVVCARYESAPASFTVKDCSCDYDHVQFVRQVVFPKEPNEETGNDRNKESL